tara:strand:+ start:293 stop:1306 length:1014 start_codon:yes stop_codon:yes gene_type:complete
MQNNMNHIEFPIPEKGTPPTSGYLKNFADRSWKLHVIQRNDTTWKPGEYRKTIQSIFSNILISPFVGSLQADGVTTHLLDGGHRTLAMMRFINNEFEVCAPSTNQLCFYKDLPEVDKKVFDDRRPLHTFVYTNLTKAQEELMFFRLNIGLPLSAGEAVRAFHTIPMCVLASELSMKFDSIIQDSICRAVLNNNQRDDAASWMLLILENFHASKIVLGENPGPSKQAENLERCENYRDVTIDRERLTNQMAFLMGVIENRPITKKFPSYVIPTVQGIMMRYPMVNGDTISSFLFDMFGLDETANPLIREWKVQATCDHNPAKPAKCEERVKIFGRWLA